MDDAEDKINAIINFMGENPRLSFDTTFIESVLEQYQIRGSITDLQLDSVNNIIESFGIDVDHYS